MSEYDVVLSTDNPQAEILLIDNRFRIVSRGVTPLKAKVPTGLYSMKVKIGEAEREELFAVRGDAAPIAMALSAPAFSSAIPLANTATTHEYHQQAAHKYLALNAPRISRGEGSSIMVCVRDASQASFDHDQTAYARNFGGFRLLDTQDKVIVDFDMEGEHNLHDRFMAARVDVTPGSYALSYDRGDLCVCLPLPTASAPTPPAVPWILQVYIQLVAASGDSVAMRPDFDDVAVAFGRVTEGFQPERFDWKVMETVRRGLIDGKNYVETSTMRELLTAKFDNPMLGLYGAHLLLLDANPDTALIETVITNTSQMLGPEYPDVVALAWAWTRRSGMPMPGTFPPFSALVHRLKGPPLLTRSWELLIEAVRETAPALFETSPAFRVAPNLLASDVYLSWTAMPSSPIPVAPAPPQPGPVAVPVVAPASAQPAPVAVESSGKLIPTLVRMGATLGVGLLRGLRGLATGYGNKMPVSSIESIKDTTEAAAVLRWIAQTYDWGRILPEIKREAKWLGELTGLQRDLFLIMRQTANDPEAIEAITPAFVDRLLARYRVPLPTLVNSLVGLEVGGFWSNALHKVIDASKQAQTHAH